MSASIEKLLDLRHELHAAADLADHEAMTVVKLKAFLVEYPPDALIEDLGGNGLALTYDSGRAGPRVLVRCELDALPIPETLDLPYGSRTSGVSHKCGHDGHMTVLSGLASHLAGSRPARGAAILLFQPAEETGQGARRVLDDPRWSAVKVDMAFALHNLPGYPMGAIILREGVFASSSRGMIVKLVGATSHAAEPQNGCSPALAVAQIIEAISASAQFYTALEEAAQATIIHARVGQRAFGTSPGEGVVMATLRAHDDCVMQTLVESCTRSVRSIAAAHGLQVEVSWTEEFPVTENHPRCVEVVRRRARDLGLEVVAPPWPFAWSEDFGWFSGSSPIALVGLGAGEKTPALHNPDYDFPDELIAGAVRLLESIVDDVTG